MLQPTHEVLEFAKGSPVSLPREGLDAHLAKIERKLITQAFIQANYQKTQAARLLQINRTTLVMMLKRHGLVQPSQD